MAPAARIRPKAALGIIPRTVLARVIPVIPARGRIHRHHIIVRAGSVVGGCGVVVGIERVGDAVAEDEGMRLVVGSG